MSATPVKAVKLRVGGLKKYFIINMIQQLVASQVRRWCKYLIFSLDPIFDANCTCVM